MTINGMARQIGPAQTGTAYVVRQVEFRLSDKIYAGSNPVRRRQAVRSARRIVGMLGQLGVSYDATDEGVTMDGSSTGFAPRRIIARASPGVFEAYATALAKSLGTWYKTVNGNPPYKTVQRDPEYNSC